MKHAQKHPCCNVKNAVALPRHRGGFVLLVVTIVLILLSLAAWAYTNKMVIEKDATMMYGRDGEARMAAESAIEYTAIQIGNLQKNNKLDVFHNTTLFRGQIIEEVADNPRGQCRFTVLVPNESSSPNGASVRFGLARETAKFNINRLIEFDNSSGSGSSGWSSSAGSGSSGDNDADDQSAGSSSSSGSGSTSSNSATPFSVVSTVPGMTEEIVNSILDWIDSDNEARVGGAESIYYEGLAVPYSCRNAPLESIEELLQIQGVTPTLFYGEDANRNGTLDPNEDNGNESPPEDNADGVLDPGWREYFTASSKEKNTSATGEKKININGSIMTELYDQLEDAISAEAATFIVAYRLFGNENASAATAKSLTVDQADLAQSIAGAASNPDGISITRAGMDLTKVAAFSFNSIYDLIDAQVAATINGAPQTLTSPWTSGNLDKMPEFEDLVSHVDDALLDGRINVNIARKVVLMAIPNMTETIADQIVSERPTLEKSGSGSTAMSGRASPTWLLGAGIVDLKTLQKMGPWLTTGGDIFMFQVLGHFDQGGPTTRLEAKIDATQNPPRIIFQRDLTSLGRGFHPSDLSGK